MTIKLISKPLIHDLDRLPAVPVSPDRSPAVDRSMNDFGLSNPADPVSSDRSPSPSLAVSLLSEVPSTPLRWLWPGRIPLGHLSLLESAPGSGLSLLALTLAACVSTGSPLPDGTPTQQGHVILFAPYDRDSDTIKPRLEAAGGDPAHVTLLRPPIADASRSPKRPRSVAPLFDLDHLASTIRQQNARLVILDPASAIPALARRLPALIDLAQQTGCAILLTRSLRQAPTNPLRFSGPTSTLREAVRSRLLLTPHPGDERQHLLLCSHHPLCTQPAILAYDILSSQADIPTIHWLGQQDRSQLERLCTGPLRSPHRQAILRFLQQSSTAHPIPDILSATCYDYEAGRKMLQRMKLAGELVSPASGLYTTAAQSSASTISDVPTVPDVPDLPLASVPDVPNVPDLALASVPTVEALLLSSVPSVPSELTPTTTVAHVPNVSSSMRGSNKAESKRRPAQKRHHKRR